MHVSVLLDKSIFQSACAVVIPLVVYEFCCLISSPAVDIAQLLHFCQSGGCGMFSYYGFYFEVARVMKLSIFY